jgi:hypothetical protein
MFPITNPHRHWACRVNDQITWQGFKALILQNERLQIVVLADKGTEIVQFLYKPLDIDFIWRSPNPLRDPSRFVPIGSSGNSDFFDRWSGGWFEVIPNGGPANEIHGAPLGQFAETINLPWEYRILEDDPQQVKVGFWVTTYRTPLLIQKTLTLKTGSTSLFIEERITNQGKEAVSFMWGHHPVIGEPFLDESCQLWAPECEVEVFHDEDGPDYRMGLHQTGRWPVIKDRHGHGLNLQVVPPKSARTMDNCYLKEFTAGWIAINSRRLNTGFGLAWDPQVFRYIWLWQALGGGIGYPWYGRTYNIGIEPWTSYPCVGLDKAIENNTALTLQPGESIDAWLTAAVFSELDEVRHISRDGTVS